MALEFIDSFQHYPAPNGFTEKGYSIINGDPGIASSGTVGPRGGRCWSASNWQNGIRYVLTSSASRTTGMRIRWSGSSGDKQIIGYEDGATAHVNVRFGASGTNLTVERNGTLLATGTATLLVDTWYFIEFGVTIADAGGRAKVVIDGVTDIDFTGDTRNAANASSDRVRLLGGSSNSATLRMADLYIEGSLTFHGDHGVDAILPDGAGNSTQFTPDSGSNYARVNEQSADADTSYVGSSTAGHIDLYTMGNLSGTASTVKATQQVISAKKTDAGARTGRTVMRVSSTNYEGSDIALSASYVFYKTLRETNPNTAATWTVSGVNGIESGAKVQS